MVKSLATPSIDPASIKTTGVHMQSTLARRLAGAVLFTGVLSAVQAPATAADLEPLRMQFGSIPVPAFAATFYAKESGIYEKAGLKVDILPGRLSQDAVNAVVAGSADIAFVLAVNHILSVDKGQKVVAVGNVYGSNAFGAIGAKDSGITKLLDLQGKKVLLPAASYESLLRAMITQKGGDPDKITYVLIPQPAAMLTAYAGKQGDAVVTVIPFAQSGIEAARPSVYMPFADEGDPEPLYVWVVRPDVLAKDKGKIRKFLKATYEAQGLVNANPAVAVDAFVKSVPGATPERVVPDFKAWMPFQCADKQAVIGRASDASWKTAVDLYRKTKLITSDMKPTDLYTNEFFEGADSVSTVKCP
jgi:NitT/TauT family transport system substrate-binding protein